MEELKSTIISEIVWDAIKRGVNITTGYLKGKLSNWLLDDAALEKIKNYVCDIPEAYLISEGMIREYINLSDKILDVLKTAKPACVQITQNINCNKGIAIGTNPGTVYINQYTDKEEPRNTKGQKLLLVKSKSKFSPIQIVKSFSSLRDKCIIEDGLESTVYADIFIPEEVRRKEGCQFSMILFSFIPSENWLNFYDENYKIKFVMETSDNINQVQLQIKDSLQQQFVDCEISNGEYCYLLSEIADREAWKDIREICFTVFADDRYIEGEKGFIRIIGFKLEQ